MKKKRWQILPLLLAVCMFVTAVVQPVRAYNPADVTCLNTYVNTGNQRQDIIGVALTQLGYMEGENNDTKFCDWYGLTHNPWCAMFVSWCARQAEVSTDILTRNAWAHPKWFDIPYYHGSVYTPQPGDLFFTTDFEHVGLVWYVEGDYFYCIEGNAKYHDPNVPNDPTVDSYHVMTNKRRIDRHYFGVPAYEGCDKKHTYTKGYDAAHPHKAYYICSTCGDKYYTGYTEVVAGCKHCFACGCDPQYAGYYELLPNTEYLRLRKYHSMDENTLCYVTLGEVVYVYGIDQRSGWAYIDFDGMRGHVPLSYLKKYPDAPDAPTVTAAQTQPVHGEDMILNWNTPANTEQLRIKVLRDGQTYLETPLALMNTYTLQALPVGTYEVQLWACNRAGMSEAGTLSFTVRDTYTVTYDPGEGSGAPQSHTQPMGEASVLSDVIPTREGYRFLGWTLQAQNRFADYHAGDLLQGTQDLTLHAVWQDENAMPQALSVHQLPRKTLYLLQQTLDTTGLVLRMQYSDGTGTTLTDGFTVEGFDSETLGTRTLTVSCEGLQTVFDVQIVPYIPGDIDNNQQVNRDDVMQLLWHISFPERFPISAPADFNGDDAVNRDDVMQLLWHISFPERFPLEVKLPESAE